MAVLTDIIIAHPADAPSIIAEWPAQKRWPAFETSGLDWLVLSDLALALKQPALSKAVDEQSPVASADETDGPWLYVVPTDLRDLIASIGLEDMPAVAKSWAIGEEAANRGLTEEVAQSLLMEIQKLAIRARAESKPMLVWISM